MPMLGLDGLLSIVTGLLNTVLGLVDSLLAGLGLGGLLTGLLGGL